jgi:glycogen debranching enzyme
LRTLSRNDPRYKPRLIGDYNKDIAYHNGCVWPWLLGFFVRSFLKVRGYSRENRALALRRYILPLMDNLTEGCVGSINEIFDGDYPHLPRGCISQAWSVGELLRCIVEDILYIRPEYEEFFRSC